MSLRAKRAALELHGLERRDQEWILGRLPRDERERVSRLLTELESMDVRFDLEAEPLADEDPPHGPFTPAPAAVVGAATSAATIVRHADAAAVSRVLDGEPDWLVEALLAVEPWPWLPEARAALAQERAANWAPRLGDARRIASARPALSAALLELVAARLSGAHGARRINGHAHSPHAALDGALGWSRWWSGVKQWLP